MANPQAVWNRTQPAHNDPMIAYALNRIEREFEHRCSVNRKDLNKFGGNPSVGTSEVSLNSWGADEVFQTSNVTLVMSSSDAGDTAEVTIEYMELVGSDFHFRTMKATLNGQNKVTLPAAGARWMRMYSSTSVAGDVYIYRDTAITGGAPDDLTFVHNSIPAGENQSQKAGTTIAYNNYFLVFSYWADVVKKTGADAVVRFKVREFGQDFRTNPRRGAGSNRPLEAFFKSPPIILPNSDIIITASSTVAATDITAGFSGSFADIEGV